MSGARYSVLVIDNVAEVVEATAGYLERVAKQNRDELEVLRAYSVSGAQRLLAEQPVDAVFVDYHFDQGMSGDELIDKIEDPFGNKLIIMMSGWDEKDLVGIITKRHKSLGLRFKFLRKPFEELEVKAKYLEMEHFFASRPLPFPLAHAEQALATSRTGVERILATKDLIESLAKYCVAVIMSDLDAKNVLGEMRLTFNPHADLTLGAWLQWLKAAVEIYGEHRDVAYMPELIRLFEDSGYSQMMYEFKNDRDKKFAHGFKFDDGFYAALADKHEPRLRRLLDGLRFTARHTLFTPERKEFSNEDPEGFEYELRVLMGTVFEQARLLSRLRFRTEQVYSYGPGGACLSLSPFFTYRMCAPCGAPKIFMLDRIRPTQLEYKAVCNHELPDVKDGAAFNRLLGGFRSG